MLGRPRAVSTRAVAHLIGEVAVLWLLAASTAASFLPRGFGLNTQDHLALLTPGFASGIGVALLAAAGCAGLWWLLGRELVNQLAMASLAVLALALVLPGGLTTYFLPGPLGLLLAAFLLSRFPGDDGAPWRNRRSRPL